MSAITDRLATTPRAPMRAIAVAALVIVALAAILVLAGGSRQPTVPAPFGPAGNGRIAWVDADGAIVVADLDGADPAVAVPGPGNDRPQFSPDGTRLAYLRSGPTGSELIAAAADGSDPVTVASGLATTIGLVWAPDSRSVVIVDGTTLTRVEARAGSTPVVIATGVDGSYDWNVEPAMLFRPPAGDQIAYISGNAGDKRIVVANADGSQPREILAPGGALTYTDLRDLRWAPDGTQLLAIAVRTVDPDTRVVVLNADGTGARQVTSSEVPGAIVSEANAQWSPDGTSILVQLWHSRLDGDPGVQPLAIVNVADGAQRPAGNVSLNGFTGFGWSPDGRSIISVDDSDLIEVIDARTGMPQSDGWRSGSGATWQRVMP